MMDDEIDFEFLAENSVDLLCRLGTDLMVRYMSPSCVRVLGWSVLEMTGGLLVQYIEPEDMAVVGRAVERGMAAAIDQESETFRMKKRDGSVAWMEANARIIRGEESGEAEEFVVIMRDVTDRKLLEEKLEAMAMTDGLTGIANRRAFDQALEREWKRTLRAGTQISLLLLDVDHFKGFNDSHGHQVGDDCLRSVAQACVSAVRQTDFVARYGGEEIAIILPMVDTLGAIETAEKVRLAILALRLAHEGNPEGGGWVSASIGAATAVVRHGGTMSMPESLLAAADIALYKAKHGGRNRVEAGLLIAPQEVVEAA